MSHIHDVVVVGARAGGAATAMLLSRLGHDVVVLDRAVFPADTVSTHQISRGGVVQLRRWGLLDAVLDSGTPPIRSVSFTADGETSTRRIKDKSGVDFVVAPRRHLLDPLVAGAAAQAGADVRFGFTVAGVLRDGTGRVTGVHGVDAAGLRREIRARYVVGADGLRSVVAREVGAAVVERRDDGGAAQYAYFGGVPWDGIELVVGERSLTGVFPTHGGEACVWICGPTAEAAHARRQELNREEAFLLYLRRTAPELAERLRHGRRTSAVTGMLRQPNQLRAAHGAGWALVGDAGYYRDAVTGHGLTDAYRDAELLTDALDAVLRGERDDLTTYGQRRDRALREVFDLTCALSSYPPADRFVELQRELSSALDAEAAELAGLPVLAPVG